MYSKIKIAGHPLHVMLVPFPIAFYTASMICYISYSCNLDTFWFKVALVSNYAGVITAAIAALPGFIDWLNIPKIKKAKKTGLMHMLCNVVALLLFAINLYVQCQKWDDAKPDATSAIALTVLGFTLTIIAGFLGWSMVQKHHIGVLLTEEQQKIDPQDGVK